MNKSCCNTLESTALRHPPSSSSSWLSSIRKRSLSLLVVTVTALVQPFYPSCQYSNQRRRFFTTSVVIGSPNHHPSPSSSTRSKMIESSSSPEKPHSHDSPFKSSSHLFKKLFQIYSRLYQFLINSILKFQVNYSKIFFASYDRDYSQHFSDLKNNYKIKSGSSYDSTLSGRFAQTRKDSDLDNMETLDPLFEKDLFLYFVFKNHLLVKYLQLLETHGKQQQQKNKIDETHPPLLLHELFASEQCYHDFMKHLKLDDGSFQVENIQNIDILNIQNNIVDNDKIQVLMDVEMYSYSKDGTYYYSVFYIEKNYPMNDSEKPNHSKTKDELEALKQFISGWKFSRVPQIMKLETSSPQDLN
ncbi:hypothetical protein FDP41_004150 [Naegleria fowleri]|uniref:Uncharacterized protein n=1 Tax=Naegleria fowleri TaxID=5763 RepID=A0A6A5BU63_NAEFO|nr:uncharacterized protein FDP41_004150 [Naegleria fowleri]KAF0976855.1 hypothetical protein FDP41_004150 [Naegleria fowleri]CAG4709396.1 unnamed protein product [Naegleria fowleri]